MTNDEGFEELAVGRHRRPANWVAAVMIIGMTALGLMCLTVPTPPAESSSNLEPPTAIGGGPRVAPEERAGGMECQTKDGAAYVADECSTEESNVSEVTATP